jgi:hypothetical protein
VKSEIYLLQFMTNEQFTPNIYQELRHAVKNLDSKGDQEIPTKTLERAKDIVEQAENSEGYFYPGRVEKLQSDEFEQLRQLRYDAYKLITADNESKQLGGNFKEAFLNLALSLSMATAINTFINSQSELASADIFNIKALVLAMCTIKFSKDIVTTLMVKKVKKLIEESRERNNSN